MQILEKSGELQTREGGLALCRLAAGYALLGKAALADTYYKQGLPVLENVLQKQPADVESAAVFDEYGAFMGKESLSVAADSPAGKAGRKRRQ